ncbi:MULTISPECIES: hypothetical protein [Streptomyces]|uniref:Uncharacterized protein n=1 Tax=Streptomyces solicathayae TaxID=3081768 RepID=A0ABZ0M3B6_9ACTN|nr:hypothetical protein [Streptomyces sp. HUAS YS2]WOX26000.1 hypothetical protein R2D22_33300 [Streptomyces sp. HUAS YS2]
MTNATAGAPTGDRARRVAGLVRMHAANFPWYAKLLADRGLSDDSPLHELPVINAELLTEHYYTEPHEQFPDADGYLTSGTATGRRKRILYGPGDDDAYAAQRATLFADFLAPCVPGAVAVADLGTGHAAALARRIFLSLGFDARDIDFTAPVEEHVKALNEAQPDVLFTMPMILDSLLRADQELDIRPRKVMVVGDVAPAPWRRRVAERLGIGFEDVLDVFGSIEIGAIGYFCAETGLYHFHDHIHPEVLTPEGAEQPADPDAGRSGLLLLTSFTRRYFPALRFATNDEISGLRTITWRGREVFAFDRIDGRAQGETKHGERISSHDLCAAVTEEFPGVPFEVVDDGLLEIRLALPELPAERADALRDRLMTAAPDVAQMVASGLVPPVGVRAVRPEELTPTRAKRLYHVQGA